MTQDFAVPPVASAASAAVAGPEADRRSTTPPPDPTPPKGLTGPGHPNPALRFEPSLGLVVLEFLDSAGSVTESIPTQRQLEAYRLRVEPPPSEKPPVDLGSHLLDGKT